MCAEWCLPEFRAGFGGIFPRRQLHFPSAGGNNTLFPRRMVPSADSERVLGAFSRAGDYIFPLRAGIIPFSRAEWSPRQIPSGKGGIFPRRRLHLMCAPFFGQLNIYFFDSGTKQAERAFRLSSRSLL